MSHRPALPAGARRSPVARRCAGVAGLAMMLLAALAGCKANGTADAATLTPAQAALVASAPAVAAAHVPSPPVLQPAGTAAELATVDAQLDKTLAGAAVCQADTECHSVAVGARACGGPTGYRAYSERGATVASVEALAQHERDLAAQAARESHQVSPCFMLADPGARCQANRCVTGRPAN